MRSFENKLNLCPESATMRSVYRLFFLESLNQFLMRNRSFLFSLILSLLSLFVYSACNFDTLPAPEGCDLIEVTYDDGIQEIVDLYCSYPGCHNQGFSWGDFTSYDGMIDFLENGKIKERAIDNRDMPNGDAIDTLQVLTDTHYELLRCWIENGYPRN